MLGELSSLPNPEVLSKPHPLPPVGLQPASSEMHRPISLVSSGKGSRKSGGIHSIIAAGNECHKCSKTLGEQAGELWTGEGHIFQESVGGWV